MFTAQNAKKKVKKKKTLVCFNKSKVSQGLVSPQVILCDWTYYSTQCGFTGWEEDGSVYV